MYIICLTPEPSCSANSPEYDKQCARLDRSLRVSFPIRSYGPCRLGDGSTGTWLDLSDDCSQVVRESPSQIDAMILRDHRNTIMLMTPAGVRRAS